MLGYTPLHMNAPIKQVLALLTTAKPGHANVHPSADSFRPDHEPKELPSMSDYATVFALHTALSHIAADVVELYKDIDRLVHEFDTVWM